MIPLIATIVILLHGEGEYHHYRSIADRTVMIMEEKYNVSVPPGTPLHIFTSRAEYEASAAYPKALIQNHDKAEIAFHVALLIFEKSFNPRGLKDDITWLRIAVAADEYAYYDNALRQALCADRQVSIERAIKGDMVSSWALMTFLRGRGRLNGILAAVHNGHAPEHRWLSVQAKGWFDWIEEGCK